LVLCLLNIGGSITSFQFPGSENTQALGVNDLGEIVGDYVNESGEMFGFLDNGGVFTTINPPGATFSTANGINDLGHIVGFHNTAANTNTIGFETSVPEPSTWAMMLLLGDDALGLRRAWFPRLPQGTPGDAGCLNPIQIR
jgi:uncharacterized membrane protein